MKNLKLTDVLRAGKLLPLLTVLILLQVDKSTSNLQGLAKKQDDLKNTGNVESNEPWQTEQPHPTIVYKEDFVREDYDEFKSKEIEPAMRKVKQNKIYFDILPQAPIIVDDNDSNDDTRKLHVNIIPLNEDELINSEDKKLHRLRRSSEDAHIVKKRNPNPYLHYYADQYPSSNHLKFQHENRANYPNRRVPIQGILWNGIDRPVPTSPPLPDSIVNRFGNVDEEDRVVWDRFRPVQSAVTPASIFHDSNPANADFGFMNRRKQQNITIQSIRPTTSRPITVTRPSIFHDSNPANADTSFLTRRPILSPTISTTSKSVTQQIAANAGGAAQQGGQTEPPITACVWAIVNCCSNRDQNVRYFCFENHGCSGAFFDLNPCGDFKNRVIEYIGGVIN